MTVHTVNKAFGPIKSSAGNANANRFFILYKVSCMANLEICGSCLVLVHNPGLNVYKAYQSFKLPSQQTACVRAFVYFS